MFKSAARTGLANRLVAASGFHPALAAIVAVACYPGRDLHLPLEPKLSPHQARASVHRMELLGWPPKMQLERLFGPEALEELVGYAAAAEDEIHQQGGTA